MKAFESALIEPQDDGTFNVTITPVAQDTAQDPNAVDGEVPAADEGQPVNVESLEAAMSEIKAAGGEQTKMPGENPMENLSRFMSGGKGTLPGAEGAM
jgi:hypothetical protein